MFDQTFIEICLSLLLGALIGAQREIRKQKENKLDFAGFRTFTLICLLGHMIGFFTFNILDDISLLIISFAGMFIILILSYFIMSKKENDQIGIMTQIVALLTFIIGILISLDFYQLSITLAILITTILVLGNKLHSFAKNIKKSEIFATLKFAIISLVILPLLPNKNYTPLNFPFLGEFFSNQTFISKDILAQLDVFNLYYMWLMVVFISGIGFIGYIMIKIIGSKKGILLTGFLGGLMSSTALTSSFSIESKKNGPSLANPLAIGVIIACSTMFFRIIFEVAVLNSDLLLGVFFSLGLMGIFGFLFAFYLLTKFKDKNNVENLDLKSPFSLSPALKFAFLYVFILFISKLFTIIYGNSGIYFISFISGATDVDAITISLASLAKSSSITNSIANSGIIIAALSNTFFKGGIAYYLGSATFSKKIIICFCIILLVGILSLIF